jgi:hypothetical protein
MFSAWAGALAWTVPMLDDSGGGADPGDGAQLLAVALVAVVAAAASALGRSRGRRFAGELAAIAQDWERQEPPGVLGAAARRLIRPALEGLKPDRE